MVALLALLASAASTPVIDGGTSDAGPPDTASATISGFDPRWSRVTKPVRGPALAIGQPGAGCVQGARALPLQGPGWTVLHPRRNRHYGHPTLIKFIRKLAAQLQRKRLPALFVGDLSQPAGGPTSSNHRSHQTGIDVDLWYAPPAEEWTPGESPLPPAPLMVDLRTKNMLPAWTPKVARLVRIVAANPAVDRIFVHPSIKRELCQDKARHGPWLRRVRPWWGHHDHLHARLLCPEDSPDCITREPLPEGDGCDKGLDWWFSDDALQTFAQRKPPGVGAPAMPEKCEELLAGRRIVKETVPPPR
jgi:penicillin-insensitive murein endopeptidase